MRGRTFARLGAAAAALLVLSTGSSQARVPTPTWAAVGSATIRPGARTETGDGQCTANLVFYDATDIYLGQAAHCAGTDGNAATNGCEAGVLPLKTKVAIDGASKQGTLVYSSWLAMREMGETNQALCFENDFALVRLARADRARVNPTIPVWGGPTGLAKGTSTGDHVYTYGNSDLWAGIGPLRPHEGFALGSSAGGWSHDVVTVPPVIPGDSGSAFLGPDGKALGVLSTIEVTPVPGSANITDLRRALQYMREHSDLRVKLAVGTEPFSA